MPKSFYARYALPLMMAMMFLAPLSFRGARLALESNENAVEQWLPARFKETQTYKHFLTYFPGEKFIVISWEGCTIDDPALQLFERKLSSKPAGAAGRPSYFSGIISGASVIKRLTSTTIAKERLTDAAAINRLRGSLIGDDGRQTCAIITLSQEGEDDIRSAIGTVLSTATDECAIPRESIHLGGPPVDNLAIDVEGERTLYRLAGLSALVGLVVSWWCLRSWRIIFIVLTAALYGGMASLAVVWYTGGTVDAVLLSMPTLLYVLTLSGAIHIINYYTDAVREGGVEGAAGRAVRHSCVPCTIAAATTALGLGSLQMSEIYPIQNFGLYSAVNMLASLVLLFVYLPAALELVRPHIDTSDTRKPSFIDRLAPSLGRGIIRRHGWVTLGCLALGGFFGIGLLRVNTSIQLMELFSPDAEIVQDYRWLEKRLGALVPMEVVIRVDPQQCPHLNFLDRLELVDEVHQAIGGLENVGSALSAATFAPPPPPIKARPFFPVRVQRNIYNGHLENHRPEFEDSGYLTNDEQGRELWRISARVWSLKRKVDYGVFVQDIEARVEPVLDAYRAEGNGGIVATYTGLVPLVYKAQRELLTGLVNSLELAFVLIAIVMIVVLRSLAAGLLSMLPNLFPVVVIFGLMGWSRILVDIGSMMTASVALGVAVDDTIHFLAWFRRGRDRGLDRREATRAAYGACARAMSQTTAIGGLGLAVFAFSTFTPTQRFGYLMLTLLVAALVGDLVMLPAMLAGPVGRFFRSSGRRSGNAETSAEPAANVPVPARSLPGQSHLYRSATTRSETKTDPG